jgi:hypothetical protein
MGDVADIGEVEEVLVGADLNCVLAALVGVENACKSLDVAFAKDTSGTDGGSEKLAALLAVGFENDLLCLCLRVVSC